MRKEPSRPMYSWGAPYFQCLDCWDEYIMVESKIGSGAHSYGTEYLPGSAPQVCRTCTKRIEDAVAAIRLFHRLRTRLVEELQAAPRESVVGQYRLGVGSQA